MLCTLFILFSSTPPPSHVSPYIPIQPPHFSPRCNPHTSVTVWEKGGLACACKYPQLVVNEGSQGDCTHVVACGKDGTFVHRDTGLPFDGTWDPFEFGACQCHRGFVMNASTMQCIPDTCAPHGTKTGGICHCDEGFISIDNHTCIVDPCAPHGHFSQGTCQCKEGYMAVMDQRVPGKWTCIDPCEGNLPCGNRGKCTTYGKKVWCAHCIFPYHQSDNNLCQGTPKGDFEPCTQHDECMSLKCSCWDGEKKESVCCPV